MYMMYVYGFTLEVTNCDAVICIYTGIYNNCDIPEVLCLQTRFERVQERIRSQSDHV